MFEVLLQNVLRVTDENHEQLQSTGTSQIGYVSANHLIRMFVKPCICVYGSATFSLLIGTKLQAKTEFVNHSYKNIISTGFIYIIQFYFTALN
jgi:hypothetical protein